MSEKNNIPEKIKIRGARVHNLKNINLDVPLNKIVGIKDFNELGHVKYFVDKKIILFNSTSLNPP